MPGVSVNILVQRVERLARDGIVERTRPDGYRLTAWGGELETFLAAVRRWDESRPDARADAAGGG